MDGRGRDQPLDVLLPQRLPHAPPDVGGMVGDVGTSRVVQQDRHRQGLSRDGSSGRAHARLVRDEMVVVVRRIRQVELGGPQLRDQRGQG
jgi:hypothetical protein